MQINRQPKTPTELHITITADANDLRPIKERVLKSMSGDVKVTGFRSGQAPLHLVERQLNQQVLLDRFVDEALNQFYTQALQSEKIRPVQPPKVTVKRFVPYTELEFEAEIPVIGNMKLADYTTLKLPMKAMQITTKDVDEVIDSLKKRLATRKPVERAAKKHDEVTIDFKGRDQKDAPIAGADGNDYPLLLGSGSFIPGFEDNLVGVKAGEIKEFSIVFPADYGNAGLRNQKVTFNVTVKTVNELTEPALDDDFAAKAGPFKSIDELKADIKKNLELERGRQARQEYENELLRKITEKSVLEIPESLTTEQVKLMEDEEKRNLTYQGQTWAEHLELEGQTEEEHRTAKRPQAEERVKMGLILAEVADREKIVVTPEELEIRIQILKGQYQDPAMQAELDKAENRQDIASRIMTEKTIAKLVEYASI